MRIHRLITIPIAAGLLTIPCTAYAEPTQEPAPDQQTTKADDGGWQAAYQNLLDRVFGRDQPEQPAADTPTQEPQPEPQATQPPATEKPTDATTASQTVKAYVTGYTWHDNTPAGSPDISHPQIHKTAAGAGTYTDPVSVAVGHSLATGQDVLDHEPGTRFYFPTLKRYGIVEDTCGDGPTPQDGPCHTLTADGAGAATWLDVWVDGQSMTKEASDACMAGMTGVDDVVKDPADGLPVEAGPVCSAAAEVKPAVAPAVPAPAPVVAPQTELLAAPVPVPQPPAPAFTAPAQGILQPNVQVGKRAPVQALPPSPIPPPTTKKPAATPAAKPAAATKPVQAKTGPNVWDKVAACESGGNWAINTGNPFSGGLQFTPQSWKAAGGTKHAPAAHKATREQQIAAAKTLLKMQGPGAWPVCSRKAGLTTANGLAAS